MLLSLVLRIKDTSSSTCFHSFIFENSTNGWLRCWIPNSGIPYSKPLSGSNVDSAPLPSEVDQMSTSNFWELSCKTELSLFRGSAALRQLNPIH